MVLSQRLDLDLLMSRRGYRGGSLYTVLVRLPKLPRLVRTEGKDSDRGKGWFRDRKICASRDIRRSHVDDNAGGEEGIWL